MNIIIKRPFSLKKFILKDSSYQRIVFDDPEELILVEIPLSNSEKAIDIHSNPVKGKF